ncbi:hypothetical protein [Pantoea sp. FN0305]|uniref:hypothetical protein n=1 Tax=Pantoea sp. FN0305 TaxID=3418559 RepID=UPI003CECC072
MIDGNYASCKEGTDGRLAFHAEAPVTAGTDRPEFDAQHTIMTNNLAWGPFRRHFAFELQPAKDLHLNNCYAEGFANKIKAVTAPYNNILLTGCRLVGNGTATGILFQGGNGGSLSINHSIIDVDGNDYAMSLFDLARVNITSTGYASDKYAVSMRNISEKFIWSNCYNLKSSEPLSLRYAKTNASGGSTVTTKGDVPKIEWLFNNNQGINSGFVYSQAQLASSASAVNVIGKSSGKIVLSYDVSKQLRYYYATGEEAKAPWAMQESTRSVTPA